jgi:hypothetical protein
MVVANAGGATTASALCPAGKAAMGGGASSDGSLEDSNPFTQCPQFQFCGGEPPDAWRATRVNGTQLTVYVICMDLTP